MTRQVGGALGVGVEQRRRLDPVLVRRIHLHPQRTGEGRVAFVVAPRGHAADMVGDALVGEREERFRIELVLAIPLSRPRIGEPIVHVDAGRGPHPLQHPVEDLLAVLRLIEAEGSEVVEQAGRL